MLDVLTTLTAHVRCCFGLALTPRDQQSAAFAPVYARYCGQGGAFCPLHHGNLHPQPPKPWLACAFAHKACGDDRLVLYQRVPRLVDVLALDALRYNEFPRRRVRRGPFHSQPQ